MHKGFEGSLSKEIMIITNQWEKIIKRLEGLYTS